MIGFRPNQRALAESELHRSRKPQRLMHLGGVDGQAACQESAESLPEVAGSFFPRILRGGRVTYCLPLSRWRRIISAKIAWMSKLNSAAYASRIARTSFKISSCCI